MFFKPPGQGQLQSLQKSLLMCSRFLDASQSGLGTVPGRQNHIREFDVSEFVEDFPGLVSHTCMAT